LQPLLPDLELAASELATRAPTRRVRVRLALYRLLRGRYVHRGRARRVLEGAVGLVAIMVIPMAVSVHSVLSFAFASSSRPGYSETVFPVYFVVAALYSGVALVVVAVAALRRLFRLEDVITPRHLVRLGFVMVAMGAAYLYLIFTEYLVDAYSGTTGLAEWVHQVLVGRYWVPFWFYAVVGGLVPILVLAWRRTRTAPGVVAAASLVVPAMWVKRLVIVVPPATEPLVASPAAAGAWGTYHFTWIPVAITAAAAAAVPLLLLLVFRFVPILPMAEMEELGAVGSAAGGRS